jgi:hypothetical protein
MNMDSRNSQYEMAYRTAQAIGQRFGRTPSGHFWGRVILKRFGELLEQNDEFLVECRVNGLVEEYVPGSAWDAPGGRAEFMRILMEWLDEIRKYPAEMSKAAIESYLHPERTAQYRQIRRY